MAEADRGWNGGLVMMQGEMQASERTSSRPASALSVFRPARAVVVALLAMLALMGTTLVAPVGAGGATVVVPNSQVGQQLDWLLGISSLPLGAQEIDAHFDGLFLGQVSPATLNSALESLSANGALKLLSISMAEPSTLHALVEFGSSRYAVTLGVDASGLIDTLLFKPADIVPTTWSQVDSRLSAIAPGASFLAARVNADGSCSSVHAIAPETARPLGSMFKLFILGALANAVRLHKISWNQKVTVTAAIKVGGSGTLQLDPDGTQLTVRQVAVKMISVSDNTGADLLLHLVGRAAVEAQVRQWAHSPSLNDPFLTVSELFALKYDQFPVLAEHYLALSPLGRARYLASTVDAVPASAEQASTQPRDINSIEWFASSDDLCRAFTGLAALQARPGLSPLGTVLSTNNGGIGLNSSTWPTVWFKGGSEPGVLTLVYLARDERGHTYVVIALTENPKEALTTSSPEQLLAIIQGAFGILHSSGR
jgi:beta-lactamase class A